MPVDFDRSTMLRYHLTHNHYPPINASMIEPCEKAIEAVKLGDSQADIDLPEGVTCNGKPTMTAGQIVDYAHLDAFIPEGVEYYID